MFILNVLIYLMLMRTISVVAIEDMWGGGDGLTPETAYLIKNSSHLELLATNVNSGNEYKKTYFKLTNDIDLSNYQTETGWIPIGDRFRSFKGELDGNGHKITGLFTRSNSTYVGLFGYINSGSKISNLGVELSNETGKIGIIGKGCVGGLVGENNGGEIKSCYVVGSVIYLGGLGNVGGLVGKLSSGKIENCYTEGSVVSKSNGINVGGLVGLCETGRINNSYSASQVLSDDKSCVGGFVGLNINAKINICYATGTVSASGNMIGGFVGKNERGYISQCYATGDVSSVGGGKASVGGFAGENSGGISETFAVGMVECDKPDCYAGGLVGYNNTTKQYSSNSLPSIYEIVYKGNVLNSYATGKVKGGARSRVGVLVGYNKETIQNCYATGQAFRYGVQIGGIAGHYYGYDITNVYWCIDSVVMEELDNPEMLGTGKKLTSMQMVGEYSKTHMKELDFSNIWQTRESDDKKHYFPQLKVFSDSKDKAMRSASLSSVSKFIDDSNNENISSQREDISNNSSQIDTPYIEIVKMLLIYGIINLNYIF